jgi:transposase
VSIAQAHAAGQPAQRSGDRRLACRALASASRQAGAEGRTIVWVDESGCYLLPTVVRTYAPRGQVPVLRSPLTRDHLALIGGVTPEGRVLLQVRDHPLRGPDVVGFLQHLLRHIPGKLLVVWDGSMIHRAQVVKSFLARGAAKRLHLDRLPAYAPELNPAEGLWHTLKRVELRNLITHSLPELRAQVRLAVARLRHRPDRLRGYVRHCTRAL